MIPVQEFKGRDVAVFGLARSGLTAARALAAGGARVHAWDDNAQSRARAESEGVPLSDINSRDWRSFAALVLSPGVPLHFPRPHRVVELARAVGVPIIGDVELFARSVNALAPSLRPRLIGVTGTNGKSTTTALIGHILRHAGKDVRVGGNIGAGILGLEPLHAGAIYVLELSSFQLDLTESLRLNVAVHLNLSPDHLDRHGGMEGYAAAKERVFANQGAGDWAVVGVDDDNGLALQAKLRPSARDVAAISARQGLSHGVTILGGTLYDMLAGRAEAVFDVAEARTLPGRHNGQNIAAAYAACRGVGLAAAVIADGVRSFPGLPHRLEQVCTLDGVRFVNDSKATNADAAAQALAVYPHIYWIAGGRAKDGGIASLKSFFPRIAKAYLIGESGEAFAKSLSGSTPAMVCDTLNAAVEAAFADARLDKARDPVVLLSPAAASFDQFTDFEARGEAFKALALTLNLEARRKAAS